MLNDETLYSSIKELGAQIRSRKLSAVDLTEAYLKRSETVGAKLNAYAAVTRELALTQARQAEREIRAGRYRGPLHGIPYAAKDLLAARGYPTSWGARPLASQKFDYDAAVITRLREAGAILIGKASMIELAGGMGYRFASASISGPARNPWNPECWTCGSSSGSGADASAALASFAIGTETWGSIICPSAFCGVSGLRPTFGRVSRHGSMALSYSMDKIGVLARTAEDCAIVLSHIAGYDARDSGSIRDASFTLVPANTRRPLRIGWVTNAWKKIAPDIEQPARTAVEVLRKHGASITDVKLPEGPWEAAAGIVISVEGASAFDSLIESGRVAELTDPLGKIAGYVNQQISAADYVRAGRIRRILQRKIDELFERFDVLAAPSLPVSASSLTANLETDLDFADPLGGIGNFCGLPALSVPCGFSSKNLPVGIQFVARALDDDKAIAAGHLFQQHSEWHRKHPPIE